MKKRRDKLGYSLRIFIKTMLVTLIVLATIIILLMNVKIDSTEEIVEVGGSFSYAKITWFSFDVSNKALIHGDVVDVNKVGTYRIRYSFGLKTLEQKVKVIDSIPPTITLKGEQEIYVDNIEYFKEPGYVAEDNYDGEITKKVTRRSIPDKSEKGKYIFIYSVEDNSGNTATIERIVIQKNS